MFLLVSSCFAGLAPCFPAGARRQGGYGCGRAGPEARLAPEPSDGSRAAHQILSAANVSATSCTRTMRAPRSTDSSAAATLGTSRSCTGSPVTAPSDDLQRPSGQPGMAVRGQSRLLRQQREILLHRLAEPDAGVQHDAIPGHALAVQGVGLATEEGLHRSHHVALHGLHLHGLRFAMHVHQAHPACSMARHCFQGTRLPQGPDVVDDVRAQVQHRLHDGGLVGIHRNGHAPGHGLLHHRHHAGQFLLQGHRRAAGAGGFPRCPGCPRRPAAGLRHGAGHPAAKHGAHRRKRSPASHSGCP